MVQSCTLAYWGLCVPGFVRTGACVSRGFCAPGLSAYRGCLRTVGFAYRCLCVPGLVRTGACACHGVCLSGLVRTAACSCRGFCGLLRVGALCNYSTEIESLMQENAYPHCKSWCPTCAKQHLSIKTMLSCRPNDSLAKQRTYSNPAGQKNSRLV